MWQTFFQPTYPSRVRVIGTAKIQLFFDITEMIIRVYPIDGLKGQKQIAYGNTVGHGNIRCRPERAKAQSLFLLLPFQGDWSASHLPKAMPLAIISLPRWGVSANCG